MHKYTFDFLKENTITSDLFSLSNIITDLKTKTDLKKETNALLFTKLETIAIKESVQGSNAIEGIYIVNKRLTQIVENNSDPIGHNEEEIAGYHDAIKFVKENYKYLSFDEETIMKIHELLMARHVGYNQGGKYKDEDNVIAEKYPNGRIKRIIFVPVKAKDTEKAMKELCLAYKVARDDSRIHPLLLIPCIILDFLSIHPFKDGNGRVSRLLTLLLLYKSGYDIGKYISLENQINIYKYNYYDVLERCQMNWNDNKNTYYPFIEFSFQIIYECYKEINKRFVITKSGKEKKNERIEAVVLNSIVPISKYEICSLLPDVSMTTIETKLSSLLKEGKIRKIGDFKNAKYLRIK